MMPKQALSHISSSNIKRMGLVTVLLLLVSLVATPAEATGSLPGPSHQQITHIVLLSGNASPSQVARSHGISRLSTYSVSLNGFGASIPEGRLRALENDPRVVAVEPNIDLQIYADPGATVTPSSQSIPTGVRRIGADQSTVAPIDGVDDRVAAVVAVLDTGVDGSHPDLNVNVAMSVDCSDGISCIQGVASDSNGHGTHVAGTIAALDNTIGVVGVAPGAEIWSVKVCGGSGSCSLSAIILGHEYISANAASIGVTNISLGGQGWSESWRQAISSNVSDGVVVVVAAGNSRRDIFGHDFTVGDGNESIPAAYSEVMTVSALLDVDGFAGGFGGTHIYGLDDTIGGFSNFGTGVLAGNPVTSSGYSIDVAAPSVDILSTAPDGNYAVMSGSSMASPHVAGVVALHVAATGRASNADGVYAIRQAVIDAGLPMADWRADDADIDSDIDYHYEPSVNGAVAGAVPPPSVVEQDAAVTSLDAPTTVISGSAADITAGIANLGTDPATITVEFIDDTAGTLISTVEVDLVAGASASVTTTWDTTGALSGGHVIRVVAMVVDDINTGNDSLSTITTVEEVVVDLAVSISVSPDSVTIGEYSVVTISAINDGNVDFSADVPVSVKSDNGTPLDSSDDFLVFSVILSGPIAPGQTGAASHNANTSLYAIGTHKLVAQLAIVDDVTLNNSTGATLTVQALPPAPAVVVASVSTNKPSYSNRDFAYITVQATQETGEPIVGATVVVTVVKPKGKPTVFESVTASDGTFVKKLRVSGKKSGCGTYTVTAQVSSDGLSDTATTSFVVCG